MKLLEIELVLHEAYGGFHFDTEMAIWLMENRNWTVVKEYDYKKKYPLETLIDLSSDNFYSPHHGDIALRSHKDVIDCVREIQKRHENDSYRQKTYNHCNKLKIRIITINAEIEDYNDGHERLNIGYH